MLHCMPVDEVHHLTHPLLSYSSAMNVVGAVRTAMDLPKGSKVVTFICDSGQRHVTRFWSRDFVLSWGLVWPGDLSQSDRLPACLKDALAVLGEK